MRALFAVAALAVAIGLLAARTAHRFLPAFNDYAPPLAEVPPRLPPAQPALARRVALVIVDGLRLDTSRELPGLAAVRARGVDARARAPFPTISRANYVTIVTGVPPRHSGARTNDRFQRVPLDSLADRAAAGGQGAGYVSDRTRGVARLFGIADITVAGRGPELPVAVGAALERHAFVVVFFLEVDEAGHAHGGDSDEYRAAARRVDAQIARSVAQLDLALDAVVIVADHGHTDRGGHGGLGADVEDVPLVLAGAGVRPGAVIEGGGGVADLADVAPTVAALLGVPAPGHGSGRTLAELLAVAPAQRAALEAADAQRRAALAPVLADLARADEERHAAALRWRVPAALGGLGVLAGLIALARRRGLPIGRRAGLAALVFPVALYALVFGVDRLAATPAVPSDRYSLWGGLIFYGSISVVLQLAAWSTAVRGAPDRPAATAGALLSGLAATAVPALAAWALIGSTLATMLPGPVLVIATPVACAGLAIHALACVLAAGAATVRAARAAPPRER